MIDKPPPRKPMLLDWETGEEGATAPVPPARPPRGVPPPPERVSGPTPADVPPVPDIDLDVPKGQAMLAASRIATVRGSRLGRFAGWVFGTLFAFVLSVAAWDFVAGLLGRNTVLGLVAFVLIGLAVVTAAALGLREWWAYVRLARLDQLRADALAARAKDDLKAARRVVASLEGIYAHRPDLRWGRARLAERHAEVFDVDGLLNLAETELLTSLDQSARREIEAAARQVAAVTALVPLALADVAAALYANLRMVRRIAEIYGGRSGSFGSVRLLRRVFVSLVAAGAVAVTDDLLQSVAGGGVLSKVSRRFGEGMVNGALTARVGVAAMELCRPLPFHAAPRPKVTNLVSRSLTGLFDR
ncbi:YcjF family protein [Cereibacter sphaeroides]|uniref:YcjF family protein n=1 Tax=Cereibacter sphaeroides TaxID=1063 RepID=UPI001F3E8E7C|nr:TIGR01620 family protein [Cereibacter sphaeroides]MCE6958242.1 YcjF family protein [Cereibacter sphaeroides]MCE6972532.1 YcjF family protein [Cereibacter sphaeroides]